MTIAPCWSVPDDEILFHQWRAPSLDEQSYGVPRYEGSVFGGFFNATWPVQPAREKSVHPV
jgi:hypothetical protein